MSFLTPRRRLRIIELAPGARLTLGPENLTICDNGPDDRLQGENGENDDGDVRAAGHRRVGSRPLRLPAAAGVPDLCADPGHRGAAHRQPEQGPAALQLAPVLAGRAAGEGR